MSHNWGGSASSSSRRVSVIDDDGEGCTEIPFGVPTLEVEAWQDSMGSLREVEGRGIDSEGPIAGVVVHDLLNLGTGSGNPQSTLSAARVRSFRAKYDIPRWVSLHTPDSNLLASYSIPGMVCMYELPFKLGLRLPLPPLVVEFCSYFHISPSQIMPNTWRVLLGMQVFSEMEKFDVNISDVLFTYSFGGAGDEGRYKLRKRQGKDALIVGTGEGDKRWKEKYFFLSYTALEVPEGCDVPAMWSYPHRTDSAPPVVVDLRGRANRFLKVPEEDREFKRILFADYWMSQKKTFDATPNQSFGDYLHRKKQRVGDTSEVNVELGASVVAHDSGLGKRPAESEEPKCRDGPV